jgi:hypothetical protein
MVAGIDGDLIWRPEVTMLSDRAPYIGCDRAIVYTSAD